MKKEFQLVKVKITQIIQWYHNEDHSKPEFRYYYNLYINNEIKESGYFYVPLEKYTDFNNDFTKKFSKIKRQIVDDDVDRYIVRTAFKNRYDTLAVELSK